jgi:hypothetical protein
MPKGFREHQTRPIAIYSLPRLDSDSLTIEAENRKFLGSNQALDFHDLTMSISFCWRRRAAGVGFRSELHCDGVLNSDLEVGAGSSRAARRFPRGSFSQRLFAVISGSRDYAWADAAQTGPAPAQLRLMSAPLPTTSTEIAERKRILFNFQHCRQLFEN